MYQSQQAVAEGTSENYSVVGHIRQESGPRIASSRNTLVRTFLDQERYKDVEWLLMLDADITFDGALLERLFDGMRDDTGKILRPISSGLYFGGGHGSIFPCMYEIVDPKTNDGMAVKIIADFKTGDVIRADAVGAGCLLMHRGVLEQLREVHEEPTPWFAESVYKGHEFGEDWTFCMKVRMQGYSIHVVTSTQLGHVKSVVMDEHMWRTGQTNLRSVSAPPNMSVELKLVPPKPEPMATITPLNREQRRKLEKTKR